MPYLTIFFLFLNSLSMVIFKFDSSVDVSNWRVVDDVVMGGRSSGSFKLNADGHGEFSGNVSLENYGGFSSVRYRMNAIEIGRHTNVVLKVKGDGKNYQFRVKANASDYFSYITTFSTQEKWQEIQIPLKSLYPSFRGRKLNMPNFNADEIVEVTILIANKKNESFRLLIEEIRLE